MNKKVIKSLIWGLVVASLGGATGYWVARHQSTADKKQQEIVVSNTNENRKPLYWYDPMAPNQHFDKPGKSPFMDMELVPKYADEGSGAMGVRIDPDVLQNLGIRWAQVTRSVLPNPVDAVATLQLDARQIALIQTRTNGFVERVYARAAGDVIIAGAPLADFLLPEWAGAQNEFLALSKTGDPDLVQAGRERLKLLGMPAELINTVEKTGQVQQVVTIRAPIGGVIQSLDVQTGMSISAGTTLARINGLNPVWLEAAIPEARAERITVGQKMTITIPSYPGKPFTGHVVAVLPEASADSRTLRVRVELPNLDGRLRPGLFAQVHLETGATAPVLWIPSEAVIRTGTRNLVLVALEGSRFQPTEVTLGQEAEGKSVILGGLTEGQKIVASGQFLIDSEASLKGVMTRMGGELTDKTGGGAP